MHDCIARLNFLVKPNNVVHNIEQKMNSLFMHRARPDSIESMHNGASFEKRLKMINLLRKV